MHKVVLSHSFDRHLAEALDDAAEEEDRPRSHIVTDALRNYLEMDPDDE